MKICLCKGYKKNIALPTMKDPANPILAVLKAYGIKQHTASTFRIQAGKISEKLMELKCAV